MPVRVDLGERMEALASDHDIKTGFGEFDLKQVKHPRIVVDQ